MRLMIVLILILPGLVWAQAGEKEDIWAPLRPLLGEWKGTGADGTAEVESGFEFVLGGRYIEAWNRSVFQPTEDNPEGEVHEDRGFISRDGIRKKFIFRQFHVEGFVNTYVLDSISDDGKTLVFTTEAVENAPPGTRAKWEIKIEGPDQLATSFLVAWPDKDYQCFSQNQLRRTGSGTE